ncbi:unnamed protein product [Allacma fusca]|uniref:VWFA domain-containing protein n=1 Tax=Allacma fusca TaxID=39272 RepID=A0A8J2Q1C1_9HEXA|nr:unnamed protein product [Allacma fusca]
MVDNSLTVFLFLLACIQSAYCEIDRTLETEAYGEDVVDAVISKIGLLFGNDHHFLKRLALVDTQFGNLSADNLDGGIWKVTEEDFTSTKVRTDLEHLYSRINTEFGIQWRKHTFWSDLRKPLFSALARHLYLYIKHKSILRKGHPKSIEQQAKFRSTYLIQRDSKYPSEHEFVSLVKQFEGEKAKQSSNAKVDLVVVLHASPGIEDYIYRRALKGISQIFELFPQDLGTTRLGFIVFSDHAEVRLSLDDTATADKIRNNLVGIDTSRPKSYTKSNTNSGIQAAYEVFRAAAPRPEARKIMVVITNGHVNRGGHRGDGSGIAAAANASAEGVTIYAIGFTQHPIQSGLLEITGGRQDHVINLEHGHRFEKALHFFSALHRKFDSEPRDLPRGLITNEILGSQEHRLYRYPWGDKNFRINLRPKSGRVEAYYGHRGELNKAWNDGELIGGANYVHNPKTKPRENVEFASEHVSGAYSTDTDYDNVPDDYYSEDNANNSQTGLDKNMSLYILVIGTDPTNNFDIDVQEVDVIPATPPST